MPPVFQPVKTTQSVLDSTAIIDGKTYFVQDSERLFFDYDDTRTEIRDIITLDTEAERAEMLAPKNKFYFILETSVLWLYKDGVWYEISGGSGASIMYQTFAAGTDLTSIELNEELLDAGSIVSVNVDNTCLLRSTYSLGADLKTIYFEQPISPKLGIDVIYTAKGNNRTAVASASVPAQASVNTLTTTKSRSTVSKVEKSMVLTAGMTYSLNLTGHTNLSFGSWTDGLEQKIALYLTVPDGYTLTLPADVKWKNGLAPELEINGCYILEFKSIDGGITVFGSIDKYI